MAFQVVIQFNQAKLTQSIQACAQQGLEALGTEALKDANYYARHYTGATIQSSITASELKPKDNLSISLVWNTPYARKVYYTGYPRRAINPNASLLWAHKGYTENKAKYATLLGKYAAARKPGGAI